MNSLIRSTACLALLCVVNAETFAQTNLRGWHACGQTWLVWEEIDPHPEAYHIYSSDREIDDLSKAQLIGRVFPQESQTVRLRLADKELTWTIPGDSNDGYTLASNETLFVSTPHSPEPQFFTVVAVGGTEVGSWNRTGKIEQSQDPVQCHLQSSGTTAGQAYRIYAHWIDGQKEWKDGRPDYPVMGNEHFNGAAAVFCIWEPQNNRSLDLIPAVFALHGGGPQGAFTTMSPAATKFGLALRDALLVALDDPCVVRLSDGIGTARTYWFGYWEGYDPFVLPEEQPVPDDAVIVDYTMRRIDWTRGWIVAHEGVDPYRVSMIGSSMGGRGALYNTRRHPESYAAAAAFSVGLAPYEKDVLLGNRSQNLKTNLPGSPTVEEAFHPAVVISETQRDMVYSKIAVGRNDHSPGAGWSSERVEQLRRLNAAGFGHHIYWDERGHGGWEGAHWDGSPRLRAQSLTRYRNDQSFPAFFNDDHNPTQPKQQPDVGNGDPADGDLWGTWAGYYDWDRETIEDTSSHWAATVYLVSRSSFPDDVPPVENATADIAVRRPQQFNPPSGSGLQWSFVQLSDSRVLQSGVTKVKPDGLVVVPSLTISKMPCRLTVTVSSEALEAK